MSVVRCLLIMFIALTTSAAITSHAGVLSTASASGVVTIDTIGAGGSVTAELVFLEPLTFDPEGSTSATAISSLPLFVPTDLFEGDSVSLGMDATAERLSIGVSEADAAGAIDLFLSNDFDPILDPLTPVEFTISYVLDGSVTGPSIVSNSLSILSDFGANTDFVDVDTFIGTDAVAGSFTLTLENGDFAVFALDVGAFAQAEVVPEPTALVLWAGLCTPVLLRRRKRS